jgi:hypothetical protein
MHYCYNHPLVRTAIQKHLCRHPNIVRLGAFAPIDYFPTTCRTGHLFPAFNLKYTFMSEIFDEI